MGRGGGALAPPSLSLPTGSLCVRCSLLHTPSSALCQASGCGARGESMRGDRQAHGSHTLARARSPERRWWDTERLGGGGCTPEVPIVRFKK